MTLPLLLLGLYLGLLVVGLLLASWAAHTSPAPEEARRVTDAAERAGLEHLGVPARVAFALTLLCSVGSASLAIARGLPVAWFLLAPLLAPPLIAGMVFYCAQKLLRGAGQLVGTSGADERVTLTSRATVGSVLCCDAAIGLVLLGIYSLATREMGEAYARFLTWIVGSAVALAAVVFARAAAAAHYAATRGADGQSAGPHPGSLAQLVAGTFHAPLLRLLSLVLLSTLGHCALLAIDSGTITGANGGVVLWLYPHLLKLLGLFALLFSGVTVRTSEDESGSEGWFRGAFVFLILMIAGAWSLSSELPVGWSRTVPAGLTFLYVALGLSIWFTREGSERPLSTALGVQALIKLPTAAIFLGLLVVLVLSTTLATAEPSLPTQALLSLLLAGTLAVAPLSLVWLLARDLVTSSARAYELAFVGEVYRIRASSAPSSRLTSSLPLLALVVGLCALGSSLNDSALMGGIGFAIFGVSAALGALILAALLGLMERACDKAMSAISGLVREHHAAAVPSGALNFESAVMLCRDAVQKSQGTWLLLCLAPTMATLVALPLISIELFRLLGLGLAAGSIVLGVGLELLLNSDNQPARASLGNLSFAICLAQGLWLLTAGMPLP